MREIAIGYDVVYYEKTHYIFSPTNQNKAKGFVQNLEMFVLTIHTLNDRDQRYDNYLFDFMYHLWNR